MGKLTSKAEQRTCSETNEDLIYLSLKTETALPRTAQTGRRGEGQRRSKASTGRPVPKVYGIRPSREGTALGDHSRGTRRTGRLTPACCWQLANPEAVPTPRHPVSGEQKQTQQAQTPATVPLLLWENSQENRGPSRGNTTSEPRRKRLKAGQWGCTNYNSRSLQSGRDNGTKQLDKQKLIRPP